MRTLYRDDDGRRRHNSLYGHAGRINHWRVTGTNYKGKATQTEAISSAMNRKTVRVVVDWENMLVYIVKPTFKKANHSEICHFKYDKMTIRELPTSTALLELAQNSSKTEVLR